MNTPHTPPTPPHPGRLLRVAALGIQSLFVATLLAIGLLGTIAPLRDWVYGLFTLGGFGARHLSPTLVALVVLAWALLAALSFFAGWRLQSRSWGRIALGYVALGAVLAYMAHDEPTFRHPVTMEEISPVFPGAETSYATLMEYGKNHPLGMAFRSPSFEDPYPKLNPTEPAEWREAITRHRAEIESHWAAFTNERAWWTQLSSFDRIGDLTPPRFDAEIMSFQVVRSLTQHGLAVASLEALDGRGDEAVDTLVPILKVGHNLQPYSRTLVRNMIGCVIERISLGTASFILDHAAVSPAARNRLAAALPETNPELGARHLFSTEYAFDFGAMGSARAGDLLVAAGNMPDKAWLRTCLNAISPFVYNPHATLNRIGDLYSGWQEVAAGRRLDQLDPHWKAFYQEESRPSIKNLFGRWFELETIPAYQKVSENYWRVQDQRAALLKRLASL
jgi:hypothetical protein